MIFEEELSTDKLVEHLPFFGLKIYSTLKATIVLKKTMEGVILLAYAEMLLAVCMQIQFKQFVWKFLLHTSLGYLDVGIEIAFNL